jgi:hypothetical protein
MKIFFTLIIILAPISISLENKINENIDNKSYIYFKIKLNNETIEQINQKILEIDGTFEKIKAQNIIDQIITEDNELLINIFISILKEEGITNIYEINETTDIYDDLYNFILELIVERLGWVNDFFVKTSNIIDDAKTLWNDRTIPREIRDEIQKIIDKLNELEILLTLLAEGKYFKFLKAWHPFVFINDTISIIESISIIANDLGILFGDIQNFINDISDFISWFRNEPWKDPILIYGRVMKGVFNGVSNVTISCMNITTKSDEYGNFSLYLYPTLSDVSFPPNEYYGIHKCVVTAQKDEVNKTSIESLSYVFSGGSIYWIFMLNDDDDSSLLKYYINKLFNKPSILFLNLMKLL